MNLIQHHPNCSADYPEKPKGEPAQKITKEDIGDGEFVYQCVDCGAYITVKEQTNANETKRDDTRIARIREAIRSRSMGESRNKRRWKSRLS